MRVRASDSVIGIITATAVSLAHGQTCELSQLYDAVVRYDAHNLPRGVAAGDLDDDGDVDIFSVGDIGAAAVLLNRGDGVFVLDSNPPSGSLPDDLELFDFDGDGDLDAIASSLRGQSLGLYLNNGDGTFEPPISVPNGRGPTDLDIGDVNGDGAMDVVVANYDDFGVNLLLGNGDGTFHAAITLTMLTNPRAICLADIDGDGILDLCVTNGQLYTMRGIGDGSFVDRVEHGFVAIPSALVAADLNDDGWIDLATLDIGDPAVYFNAGDGTFGSPVTYDTPGANGYDIKIADVNADGQLDLVVAGESVSVLLGDGEGGFGEGELFFEDQFLVKRMVLADLDGNGELDIVGADQQSRRVAVLINQCTPCSPDLDGDGALTIFDFLAFQNAFDDMNPIADFDGDGDFTLFDFLEFQNAFDAGCP